MKNTAKIFLFFAFAFIIGCKEEKQVAENTIEINPNNAKQTIFLSELVDSVSYIKLETNPDCIMGNVREIIIKKKYIYAIDKSQMIVFVFDKKGKFISKLDKRGKGPSEYSILGPVFVSDNEDFIEVIDFLGNKSRLLKYSNIKFDLLEEDVFIAPSANTCRKENNTYYFSAQQIENTVNGKKTNADIIVVKDGKIQKALFKKKIVTQGNTFAPNTESFTKNDKGELFTSLMYNNTFYKLSNMNKTPLLTVDFGVHGIDNSIGLKSTAKQIKYLEESEGLASFPVLNANTARILAFSYYFKENSRNKLHQYVKMKNSNKIFHAKEIVNDITTFPERIYISSYYYAVNHEVLYKNFLVDIILPWHSIKKEEIEINTLGKVKAGDNPIIMMMKLKD